MKRSDTPALALGALRAAGSSAFLVPAVGARTFGIPADAEGKYLIRMFAARNIALTAGLLISRGRARRLWYQAGVLCDALDVGAGLLGFTEGKERKSATIDTGAALAATALGVAGLLMDRPAKGLLR